MRSILCGRLNRPNENRERTKRTKSVPIRIIGPFPGKSSQWKSSSNVYHGTSRSRKIKNSGQSGRIHAKILPIDWVRVRQSCYSSFRSHWSSSHWYKRQHTTQRVQNLTGADHFSCNVSLTSCFGRLTGNSLYACSVCP